MGITPNYDLDIDTSLGGSNASDYVIPSQKAIKTYVDNNGGVPSNMVTTDTAQDITQPKTFIGQKLILFKQASSSNKLGFTLYNNSGTEKGYLEYNPSNNVDGVPLMTLGNYASASAGLTHVGFRKYSSVSGASGAYNLLAPLISDARTPFNLTTTYTNFYLPLGFTDGNTTVLTAKTGLVDISSLLPTVPTNISAFTNDSGYITSTALNGYATEHWVQNQGYVTSSVLYDYATKTWVGDTLYDYATQTWVNNQGYATETWVGNQGYALSSSLSTVATSGSYTDLINQPTIPTVNNATITFTQGGTTKGTITLNQSSNDTIALDAGGGGGASALTDLSDVSITSAASGDVLSFDGSDWINTSGFIKNIATGTNALSILSNNSNGTATTLIGADTQCSAAAQYSTAIGYRARLGAATSAIQLGYGTNSTTNTLSVGFYNNSTTHYNWQLLDGETGLIPDARLSSNIARSSDIDGNWTASGKQVLNNTSLNGSSDFSFDLTTYLPNTSDLYEILITANCKTGTTAGNSIAVIASLGGYPIDIYLCSARTTANGESHGSGSCMITVKRTDTFKIKKSTNYNGSCNLWFAKYRKVR